MSYQLEFGRGGQRGAVIPLPKEVGQPLFIGRGPHFAIFNKNISRKHIAVTLLANDRPDRYGCSTFVQVKRVGVNPSVLLRKSSQEEIYMFKDRTYNLKFGDTLFLIPTQYPITLGLADSVNDVFSSPSSAIVPVKTTIKRMPKLEDASDKENQPPNSNSSSQPPTIAKPAFATPQPIQKSRSIKDFFTPPTSGSMIAKRKYPFSPQQDLGSPTTKKARRLSRIFSAHSLEKIKALLKQSEGDEQLAADALLNDTQPLELSQELVDVMNDKPEEEEEEEEEIFSQSSQNHNNNNGIASLQGDCTVYRLNHLPGFSPSANDSALHIRQLVQAGLQAAVMTTYKVEMNWLLEQCPILKKIPFTLIHGEAKTLKNPKGCDHFNIFKPELPIAYGVNHGKMMLLYYPTFLRVVVSTANLQLRDYERKTQGAWFQDFAPKREDQQSDTCDFEETLVDYFSKLGLPNCQKDLRKYDYSPAQVVLIPSVPGYHSGTSLHTYGHMKVRKTLEREDLPLEFIGSPVVCQFSSVGSLTKPWLDDEFLASFASSASGGTLAESELQLVWPSVEMVKNSVDGYEAGHSLCLAEQNCKELLKPYFYKYIPNQRSREHVTPHIKMVPLLGKLPVPPFRSRTDKAAWGTLQKKGKQLMVRHFEMGVLFLPSLMHRSAFTISRTSDSASGSFAVPFSIPLQPFSFEGEDRPWVFDKSYADPDGLGKRYRHHAK